MKGKVGLFKIDHMVSAEWELDPRGSCDTPVGNIRGGQVERSACRDEKRDCSMVRADQNESKAGRKQKNRVENFS